NEQKLTAVFRARRPGVIAGLAGARLAFTMLQKDAGFEAHVADCVFVQPGDVIATVTSHESTVIAGESTALNL
ncbi:nicotinate-nucleotide diphosphorylase (carboxylating), partial [Neokomagataea sp. TBRC 2177]|nr:nicotinate-nucleotide diphosphorylase (carboxylating) [Neokomagataea anthophila]